MSGYLIRTEALLGPEAVQKLKEAKVLIAGLGGVGGWAMEALVRSGVGQFVLVDKDCVDISNINRQLVALQTTIGQDKVEVAKERLFSVNNQVICETQKTFINKDNAGALLDQYRPTLVIDAIDSVGPKAELIAAALERHITVISCLGAANRTDPTALTVGDLFETTLCPLARMLRKALRKKGIYRGVEAVYSKEEPKRSSMDQSGHNGAQKFLGSYAPVVATAGFFAAYRAIEYLKKN